jgi:hypothetical protein
VKGRPFREKGKWGTRLDPTGSFVADNIHHDILWQYITSWT